MPQQYDDIHWPNYSFGGADPAQSITKFRYRYYFDTPLLVLFSHAVELRIEKKGTTFRHVIKIGNGATAEHPMLGRKEYPAQLKRFKPNLSAIDKTADHSKEIIAFLRKTVGKPHKLKPLIAIQSQRRKLEYHPEGNRNITIEIGIDVGTGVTVTNFDWTLCQIELKIKENKSPESNALILEREGQLLKDKSPVLTNSLISKPAKGFNNLIEHPLFGTKALKSQIGNLPQCRFQRLSRIEPT